MKKFFIVILLIIIFLGYFCVNCLPSGAYSRDILKKLAYSCVTTTNCEAELVLANSEYFFQWDELYIFPNTLGAGENGAYILNNDRRFFDAIQIVFTLNKKPIYEEYQEVIPYGSVDFIHSKFTLNYPNIGSGYYKCNKNSSLMLKYDEQILVTPVRCDFFHFPNDFDNRKIMEIFTY